MSIVNYFADFAAQVLLDSDPKILKKSDATFLDVCAGPATFSAAVINKIGEDNLENIAFTITDYSPGVVELAKKTYYTVAPNHPKVYFEPMDVQGLNLEPETFDVVGCMFGYFVPDRLRAFSEVCRVSKTGGTSIIGTWKYSGLMDVLNNFLIYLNRYRRGDQFPWMQQTLICSDPNRLTAELLAAGFKDIKIHEMTGKFIIPVTLEMTKTWFTMPLVKGEFENYTVKFLYQRWCEMLRTPGAGYNVNWENQTMEVEYTALVAVALK